MHELTQSQLLKHHSEMLSFLFFTPYEIIYESFELHHAAYSKRRRDGPLTHNKSDEIQRHFDMTSERLHLRLLRDDIALEKALTKLESQWYTLSLPYFHRYYFEKYLFTAVLNAIPALIEHEYQLLAQRTHLYFQILKSVQAREACLRQLKKTIIRISENDLLYYGHVAIQKEFEQQKKESLERYKEYRLNIPEESIKVSKTIVEEFVDLLQHMNTITLYCIELIEQWKSYIRELTNDARKQKERIEFYFYDENYYLKMLSDLGFIRVSVFSKLLVMAPQNDLFLLHPVIEFEKRETKDNNSRMLYELIKPSKEQLPELMNKLELLSEEYKYNIKSRRNYNIEIFKSKNIQNINHINTLYNKQTGSNKIQKKNNMKLRTLSIPYLPLNRIIENDKYKKNVILEKNEKNIVNELADEKLLKYLKEEVIKKVREDYKEIKNQELVDKEEINNGKKLNQEIFSIKKENLESKSNEHNKELEMLIEGKIAQEMKKIFPYMPEKEETYSLKIELVKIKENEVGKYISTMFANAMSKYEKMQLSEEEVLQQIDEAPYCLILKTTVRGEEIGQMILILNNADNVMNTNVNNISNKMLTTNQHTTKVLHCIYLSFIHPSELEKIIDECLIFLWEHESVEEILFTFRQPSNNELISQLLETLRSKCLSGTKQLYSNTVEIKLVYRRESPNVNYQTNNLPCGVAICSCALLADRKLMLEKHSRKVSVSSEYWLMVMVRKFIKGSELVLLKESLKERFKTILDRMQEESNHDLKEYSCTSVTELHNILCRNKERLMEVSDIVKQNEIHFMKYEIMLSIQYKCKATYENYHIYEINNEVEIVDDGYVLPVKEGKYKIIVREEKINNSVIDSANVYNKIKIGRLWVPMCRNPEKYEERDDVYVSTGRSADLQGVKKEFIVGECMEWFTDMPLVGSISYEKKENDIVLEKPINVRISAGNNVIYNRTFV